MANEEVKTYIRKKDVKFWKVANALGICAETFSRKLRNELTSKDKEKIKSIVDEISISQIEEDKDGSFFC